jgi:hypothetical protein
MDFGLGDAMLILSNGVVVKQASTGLACRGSADGIFDCPNIEAMMAKEMHD